PGRLPVVDVIGVGAGVVDRLRELKIAVSAFNASESTTRKDRSGELGFTNVRSAAWWNLRELLDPAYGPSLALPPDDLLAGDLTAPHWRVTSSGSIQVEVKDETRKRLGRSPDSGDAVMQAVWVAEDPGNAAAWIAYVTRLAAAQAESHAAAEAEVPALPTDARAAARTAELRAHGAYW